MIHQCGHVNAVEGGDRGGGEALPRCGLGQSFCLPSLSFLLCKIRVIEPPIRGGLRCTAIRVKFSSPVVCAVETGEVNSPSGQGHFLLSYFLGPWIGRGEGSGEEL